MDVFHYVLQKLVDMPLFESEAIHEETESEGGAIYNDFDNDPAKLLCSQYSENFCFSQLSSNVVTADIIPQEAVDKAVLEADRVEGIFYEHLYFDSER